MKKKILCLAALVMLTLLGCGAKQPPKPPRVVTSISVMCSNSAVLQRRYYNTDEKMQLILQKIRGIGLRDTPDTDPEGIIGRTLHITITFSDGTQKIYSQKNDRYFREGNGPWTQVDATLGAQLYLTILQTPGNGQAAQIYKPHPIQLPGTGNLQL